MNKNYSCDIVKDLLPGYIDGILSEAGTNTVREHLMECEKCNQVYLEMKEELNTNTAAEEQPALDGLKKVRQHTRKLKLTVGIVTSMLIAVILSILLKAYVIGEPLSTHQISITNISYDRQTDDLVIDGTIELPHLWAVSRVVWKPSKEDDNTINITVYVAKKLSFQQDKKDFSVTIPDMKGKSAYLACPYYDRQQVYNWNNDNYEKLAELEEEIYSRFPELDRTKDALTYIGGIETIDGADGIHYIIETVTGEDAYFWQFDDKLITYGGLETQDYEIWISLDKPYRILVYDRKTGKYSEDLNH